MSEPALEIQNLRHSYFTEQDNSSVIDGISFVVKRGELVSLVGPSGCGKTTILRIVAGLIKQTFGMVKIGGEHPEVARQKHRISVVFQEPALMPWRSVIKNVMLPLEIVKDTKNAREIAENMLNLVGLHNQLESFPYQLSGGMKHRVALARALTFEPLLLLMDEPFASLDFITRLKLNEELARILNNTKKTSVLFVTHDISEAIYLSDRIHVLGAKPAAIKITVDIKVKKPRNRDFRNSPEFANYVSTIMSNIE